MDKYRKEFLSKPKSKNEVRRIQTESNMEEEKIVREWREREKELGLDKRYMPIKNPDENIFQYPPERLSPNQQLSNDMRKEEEITKKLIKRANKVKEYMPEDVKNASGNINLTNASGNPVLFESYITRAENLKRGVETPSPNIFGRGGKRKTNKRKLNKKKQTKKRKTLKKNKKSNRKQKGGNEKDIKKYIKDVIKDVIKMLKEFNNETDLKKKVQKFKNLINNLIEKLKIQYEVNENNLEMQGGDNHVNPDISVIRTSIREIRLRVIWLITTLSIIARALERAENDMLEGRVLGPFGLTFRTLLISFGVALVAFVISRALMFQYNILDVHTNSLEALQEQLNYDIEQLNIMQNGNNTIDDNTIGELLEVMIGMRTEIANAISVRLQRPT